MSRRHPEDGSNPRGRSERKKERDTHPLDDLLDEKKKACKWNIVGVEQALNSTASGIYGFETNEEGEEIEREVYIISPGEAPNEYIDQDQPGFKSTHVSSCKLELSVHDSTVRYNTGFGAGGNILKNVVSVEPDIVKRQVTIKAQDPLFQSELVVRKDGSSAQLTTQRPIIRQ